MGYTTNFEGRFETSRPLTVPESNELKRFSEERHGGNTQHYDGVPGFWCQWTPSEDGLGIEWDGGEKFYAYVEWIQLLMDNQLKNWGITLSGKVKFQGEDFEDVGYISIEDGKATIEKLIILGATQCPNCGHEFVPPVSE